MTTSTITTSIKVSKSGVPTYAQDRSISEDSWTTWSPPHAEEHAIVEMIRKGALQYRIQSAAHFDIPIEIHQADTPESIMDANRLRSPINIKVVFRDFSQRHFRRKCRVKHRGPTRGIQPVSANLIQVQDSGRWVSLHKFLTRRFTVFDEAVKPWVMHSWWNENGKTFHWERLPTELKEHIIQFCLHQCPKPRSFGPLLPRLRWNPRIGSPFEVTDQLGDWRALLHVSRQVRALALRLCFMGSSELYYDKGLCLFITKLTKLQSSLSRLANWYQMAEPDGVPVDAKTRALAMAYCNYPRIYPELKKYATFRHGIRRISLSMDFMSFFHFFRVMAHGFKKHWRPCLVSYKVLEQLPHLNELVLVLPNIMGKFKDATLEPGPYLFHYDPEWICPRILHRLVYERAAEALASYDCVHVFRFMDEQEQERYESLRRDAIKALKFPHQELHTLYQDDQAGGIGLEESIAPCTPVHQHHLPLETDDSLFWPPKCCCPVRCRQFIRERALEQQYR